MNRRNISQSGLQAGLTIGVAWNGVGDPADCFAAGLAADFVTEILVSPMNQRTADLASEAARGNPKVRILPPGDSGIYSAWNKLVAACSTTHMAFHGIDDLVRADPEIGTAVSALEPGDMLVCSIAFATPQGVETAIYHHRETLPPALSLGRHANAACPEVCWPVALVREIGGLDESFRIAGDVDLWFRLRPLARRVDCEAVLLTMLDGGASARARFARTIWIENRRIALARGQHVPATNLLAAGAFLNGRHLMYRLGGERFADKATDMLRRLVGKSPRYSLMHREP